MMQEAATPKLSSSIFEDEVASTKESEELVPGKKERQQQQVIRPQHLAPTQDPDPRSRLRWERKVVMRMVKTGGKENRSEIIRRTEREMRYQSPFMPTSVKKLVHLARQVAGKNVDDALVQMRYSKKKMAREMEHHLALARDRAVVEHGMGLGKVNGEAPLEKPRKIQDKEGNWMTVGDPSRMYIAQAWVGRGPWRGQRLVHLGRGRKGVHMKPSTSTFFCSFPLFRPLVETCRGFTPRRHCPPSKSTDTDESRHLLRPQGGAHPHPRVRRGSRQGTEAGPLGPPPQQAHHRSAPLLHVVRGLCCSGNMVGEAW